MHLFNFNQSQNSNHVPILKALLCYPLYGFASCIMKYERSVHFYYNIITNNKY